ncbi:MAG: hypothetical protein IIY21_21725 [Clostridiales bacterium]|nr:hypothetical protein [Clostridiales bacterium]MBQ1571017.1 hypothetical protein [Clostridiales bacterium]
MSRFSLKPGDTIRCRDANDMVETMYALADEDIDVEFLYEKDGEKGYWLLVTGYFDCKE